jgi:hypothetical protein
MAKIILETNNTFSIGANASDSTVYGAAGTEKVILAAGSYASIDQNVERTELSGASSSYTYTIAGNKIIVSSGSKPVATIIGGNGNKTIAFSDGSATLALTGLNKATLGGKTISTTASSLSGINLTAADISTVATQEVALVSSAVKAALTDANGKTYSTVETAITSNDINIAAFVMSKALTDKSGKSYSTVDAAITSNDATVISAALAGTGFTSITDLIADRAKLLNLLSPATLSVALNSDTGISSTDGITNNKIVNVTGLEVGATWQYSVNGVDFVDGTGTSFDLPKDGEFAAGKVLVKQTDAAGNVSATASLRVATLDTKADDLSIDLAADTGSDTTDGITSVATVIVSGLEDGATWQYRIKAGDFVNGRGHFV